MADRQLTGQPAASPGSEAGAIVAEARRQAAEILARAEQQRWEPGPLSAAGIARILGWTEGQVCTVAVGLALAMFGMLAGVVPALRHRPSPAAALEVPTPPTSSSVSTMTQASSPASTVAPPAFSGAAILAAETPSAEGRLTSRSGGAAAPAMPPDQGAPALPVGSGSVFATTYGTAGGVAVASDGSVLVTVERGAAGEVLSYRPDGSRAREYKFGSVDGTPVSGLGDVIAGRNDDAFITASRPAVVIRLDLRSGDYRPYASVPDVSPCFFVLVQAGCEPGIVDHPPRPWGLALDPSGRLYVGDEGQGMIWRVPVDGGAIEPWAGTDMFTSPTGGGGPAGLALASDGSLLVDVPATGIDAHGALDRVAVGADGRAGAVSEMTTFAAGTHPMGLAVDRAGVSYVVLGGAGTVAMVAPDGAKREHLPSAGSTPLANPSAITFSGESVLVTDQPSATSTRVVRIIVGDRGPTVLGPVPSNTSNGGDR